MICVTPYVVEERSGVSKTGFRHMGWLKSGIGIVMQPCERLPWRGVRHMVFPIRNKGTASWVSRLDTGDERQSPAVMPWA